MFATPHSEMDSAPPPPCLEPEELAAFMDGRLDPLARRRVLVHLDTCRDCYELLAASARPLDEGARTDGWWRRHWMPAVGVAAAAGLAAVFILNPAPSPDRPWPAQTPGAQARQTPIPPLRPPQGVPTADDPTSALLASAPAARLAKWGWSEGDEARALAPSAATERQNALLAGVYEVDLAVALLAHSTAQAGDLADALSLLADARGRHPQTAALGRLVEASRLAVRARAASFFNDGSVRVRFAEAAKDEPDPRRQRVLLRLSKRLGEVPASAAAWTDVELDLTEVLRFQ